MDQPSPRLGRVGLGRLVAPRSPFRRQAMLSAGTSVALAGFGLVTAPVLARSLGPEGRGEVAAVLAPVLVLSWLLPLGVPSAAAYFLGPEPEGRLLSTTTALGVLLGVPLSVVLWFVAPHFLDGHSEITVRAARAFLLTLPLTVGIQSALEMRRRLGANLVWNTWRSVTVVVPALSIVGLAVAGRLTVGTALAAYFAGTALPIAFLVSRFLLSQWAAPSFGTVGRLVPYAWRSVAASLATSVTARLDQVILATAVPSHQLGLYAVAVSTAAITSPLTSGISHALFGHLRDEPSPERGLIRFRRSLAIAFACSVSVALILAIGAPVLLDLVFGERFRDAARPLRLLLPGAVAYDVLVVTGTKLLAEGRPGEASRAAVLGMAITLIGLVVAVPHLGIAGAAAVTSLAFISEVVYLARRGAFRSLASPAAQPGSPPSHTSAPSEVPGSGS